MFYAFTQPYFSPSEVAVPVAGRGSSASLRMNGTHGVVFFLPASWVYREIGSRRSEPKSFPDGVERIRISVILCQRDAS